MNRQPRPPKHPSDSELVNLIRECLGLGPIPGSKPPRKPKVSR